MHHLLPALSTMAGHLWGIGNSGAQRAGRAAARRRRPAAHDTRAALQRVAGAASFGAVRHSPPGGAGAGGPCRLQPRGGGSRGVGFYKGSFPTLVCSVRLAVYRARAASASYVAGSSFLEGQATLSKGSTDQATV